MKDSVGKHHGWPKEVETRRLDASSSLRSMHRLVTVGEDRLVLRSTNLVRGIAIALLVLGAAILLGWGQTSAHDADKVRSARAGVGTLFLVLGAGVWLAPDQAVFDRRSGRLRRRRWFFHFDYPLEDVVGVQIIYGGRHRQRHSASYESRELNLLLNNAQRRVNLTNHADHATTRRMADEISRFLKVPLWDAFEGELTLDPNQDVFGGTARGRLAVGLRWVASIAYGGAFVVAVVCISSHLQQGRLDELEAERRPVRARLVASEVKEWTKGNDDWAAFGTFEILAGDERARATGNLIPRSFYASYGVRPHRRAHPLIPRGEAEKFLPLWEIGRVYDGYVYPDTKEHIFFELPGAAENALRVRRFAVATVILLTLGLIASAGLVYLRRNRLPVGEGKASSAQSPRSSRFQ